MNGNDEDFTVIPQEAKDAVYNFIVESIAHYDKKQISEDELFAKLSKELDRYHSKVATAQFLNQMFR
jgi:hypothetical protein